RDRPQRQVPLESDAQFALDAEPAEIAESDTRSGPVNAPLENSPDDRLVESAHPLHAQRGQPDLVADRFAFGGSHEPYELILHRIGRLEIRARKQALDRLIWRACSML